MPALAKEIINLLVGVALFLAGMSIMSKGLKKATGKGLKRLFNKIGNNRFSSLGIGAGVTALIQSSGATSVMTVGFMNAGVMTIFQGLCVILGAYIGTTVTGILVSLSGVDGLSACLALTAVVGVILNFFKKDQVKNIGQVLTGLGILFVGLELMKGAFSSGSELLVAFQNMFTSIQFPLLLLIVGALFTCLTQSSSATTGIVIVLASSINVATGQPMLALSSAFYLVLGATIGTVLVTIMAAIGGSIESKRTAAICLVVRTITALLALAVIWPIEVCCNNAISNGLKTMMNGSIEFSVAMFAVFYGVISVAIVLPFVNPIIKVAEKAMPDKAAENKRKCLKFIDDNLLITPTVALGQAKNEIDHMLALAKENVVIGYEMMRDLDFSKEKELINREDEIDYINNALTDFLIKIGQEATMKDETRVGAYFHTVNDIERIGDHAYNFYDSAIKMKAEDLKFTEHAIKGLDEMFNIVMEMFELSEHIFMKRQKDELSKLHELEDKTDKLKLELNDEHYIRISKNQCKMELSPFYTSLISEFERIADHLVNVGYAIINPTGDDIHVIDQGE